MDMNEFERQFDSNFSKATRAIRWGFLGVMLANAAILAVVTWAIIKVVNHFT